MLAGAHHLSAAARGAARRSGANLLCAATRTLEALPAVGLTERLADSLCVVFDVLGYRKTWRDCCGGSSCSLLETRTARHSAADRGAATTGNASAYLATYLDDPVVLAALYEGNALDCELYAAAAVRLGRDVAALRVKGFVARGAPAAASAWCARGRDALARFSSTSPGL